MSRLPAMIWGNCCRNRLLITYQRHRLKSTLSQYHPRALISLCFASPQILTFFLSYFYHLGNYTYSETAVMKLFCFTYTLVPCCIVHTLFLHVFLVLCRSHITHYQASMFALCAHNCVSYFIIVDRIPLFLVIIN